MVSDPPTRSIALAIGHSAKFGDNKADCQQLGAGKNGAVPNGVADTEIMYPTRLQA